MTVEEIKNKIEEVKKTEPISGMTVNERLFVTGLLDEFERAKQNDKQKAKTILGLLGLSKSDCDVIVK
jgi:hypothetical protein